MGEAIPATGRTPVELPNTLSSKIRIKLVNGDLVAEKLDNAYLIRIDNEFFYPDSKSGAVDPAFGVRMPKSYRDPVSLQLTNFFGGGKLTINDDLQIQSGSLRILGSDGYTPILVVANDDGHPGDGSLNDPYTGRVGMYFNGNINNYGKLSIYDSICQEYGTCTDKLTFDVDNTTGSLNMGQKLYIEGKVLAVADNALPLLHIDNIGSAGVGGATGPRDFIMYQDGAIDAFGIKQYFTSNGGRRWTYVAQSLTGLGQTQTNPLQPNNNYIINCSSGSNTVLYLPDYATTGDIIRFIEVSGNLQFNTNLVIRALKISNVATAIQGDITGSKINAGAQAPLGVAWDSGELIVQTRNASFGLLFVGQSDAPGDPLASEIPANLRGWWLMEL